MLSDKPDVHDFLQNLVAATGSTGRTDADGGDSDAVVHSRGQPTSTVAKALAGFPDLVARSDHTQYDPATFLAYPQVPAALYPIYADKLSVALVAQGFKDPLLVSKSPLPPCRTCATLPPWRGGDE